MEAEPPHRGAQIRGARLRASELADITHKFDRH
jgi:hypothetical protein